MGHAEQKAKASAQAAYMKAKGIMRRTGACPWGCGAQIPIGGERLLAHLNTCRGGGAKRRR